MSSSSGNSETSDLIRTLSRRQWTVSLAAATLAMISLLLGWQGLADNEQLAEIINIAGRQRMLSQRMAMFVALQQHERDPDKLGHYRKMTDEAAADFEKAHALLAGNTNRPGQDPAIRSMYFGPAGSVDADSKRYLAQIRTVNSNAARGTSTDTAEMAAIVAAAGSELVKGLHEITVLHQRDAEKKLTQMLRLLQVSTLLVVLLAAFGMFRILTPVITRLRDDLAARDKAEANLRISEERFKAFSDASSDWFWQTDVQHRFDWFQVSSNAKAPFSNDNQHGLGKTRFELRTEAERAETAKWAAHQEDLDARRPFRDLEYQIVDGAGQPMLISVSGKPRFDSKGNFLGYRGTGRDLSALQLVREREARRNRILEAMAAGAPTPMTLRAIAVMAETEMPGSICSIRHLDREQHKLFGACESTLAKAVADIVEGQEIGPEVGAGATAAFTGKPVIAADIANHPTWEIFRSAAAAGLRACWSTPVLSSEGLVLATLDIYHPRPRMPDAKDTEVLELVASLAAICMERDEAEQSLKRQQEHARLLLAEHETILSNAMVGIVYLKHRRVISCNRRLEEIFGYEHGELIGQSTEILYDTHESFVAVGEEAYRVVADNRNYNTELLLRRKDGSLFHGALNGCAIDPAKPHDGSIWVYADISERYQAEREARKLLRAVEQSPVSIVITNPEGLIEYVNPRFTRVTGYSLEEALGQNPRILQSGQTPPETYQELWQAITTGREWRGVIHNRRKNGDLFWEEASISPIVDETGNITHFLAVKEDVTERKSIEDELEQHRAHLEELVRQRTADLSTALEAAKAADQAKDAFLAHVSHELRTPLNAMIGLSELARRISSDPRQQDYLDKANRAGKTLSMIINDLLDLSKISASRMELEETTFSLRQLVQRSKSVMAHRAEEKGLKLVEKIAAEVPDVLIGDPLRIEQILLNLVSNAIKFTSSGRVEVRIDLKATDRDRVCLDIEVEDTGIGLSSETIDRLFQPFVQADASMNRKFGGTGLGLVLCKRLAEMMQGSIGVTSREEAGTTFHVELWLALGKPAELPQAEQEAELSVLPASYRNARILLVDDQPLNREVVEALLAEVDIVPQIACNGQEAIDIVRTGGPRAFDLVLMDIQMPVMDGLAATRKIRGWPGFENLPIVAMTAHVMAHEIEVSSAAGMNDHIGKPFETNDFFRLLARWIPAAKHQLASGSTAGAGQVPAHGLDALTGIDTRAGLARFVGNEKRYRHWLREFLREAPDYADQIRQLLAAGDHEKARQTAHAIKGRVGMLGMTGLQRVAAMLETAISHKEPGGQLLEQMRGAVEQLSAEIRTLLGDAPADREPAPQDETPATDETIPESILRLIDMLRRADGGSIESIERCLAQFHDTSWDTRLRHALQKARNFDFDAAARLLEPGNRNPSPMKN